MSESETQRQFFEVLLKHYPRLAEFWNREKREFDEVMASPAVLSGGVLSSGEKTILKALASIWLGSANSTFQLDITDLAALPVSERRPLVAWIANPFWP